MKTIQLTISLPRCRRDEGALEIAEAAAEHLLETFNDDASLGLIWYRVCEPPPSETRKVLNAAWDALSDILEEPGVMTDAQRNAGLKAINRCSRLAAKDPS